MSSIILICNNDDCKLNGRKFAVSSTVMEQPFTPKCGRCGSEMVEWKENALDKQEMINASAIKQNSR